jgi:homogentisate 1,2-dioxygenase
MLDRMAVGEMPAKHHIVSRGPDGSLRREECLTRQGFDGPYTILYHQHRPQAQHAEKTSHGWQPPRAAMPEQLAKRHYLTQSLEPRDGAPLDVRRPIIFNTDVVLSVLHPTAADPVYFSNGDGDDLYFIHAGSGTLKTIMGSLRYEPQDYVFAPKGVPHRFIPDEGVAQYWLSIECLGKGMRLLDQWRNSTGQLKMDAPYCHRDFRRPTFEGPFDEGIRQVVVKRYGRFHGFAYDDNPMDVVGWDGSLYPWVFPIRNFQPRAGLVHLPPTWHGTFAAQDALICSFVPRAVDFHPEAIPCPYPHASVDCDEVLFYVEGNFTSRRGVGPGSVSFHPMGLMHGPHPGAYEASIGHRETTEMAVMMDTFKPLVPTQLAASIEDTGYQESFF